MMMMVKVVGETYDQKPVIGSDNAAAGWHCTATWFRAKVRVAVLRQRLNGGGLSVDSYAETTLRNPQ